WDNVVSKHPSPERAAQTVLFRPFRARTQIRGHDQPGALPQAGLFSPVRARLGHCRQSNECRSVHISIPHIAFIKLDTMSFEQRAQFILEVNLAMMFLLSLDISLYCFDTGLVHGETRVSRLPTELLDARPIGLHPFRTPLLHLLNQLLQRMVLRQCEERVNVVFHAANHERGTFPLLEDSRLIREQNISMFLWNQRLAMFGAIHEMHEILDERLGHEG